MQKVHFIILFILSFCNKSFAQVQFNARDITTIIQDKNNDYWIGTSGEGLYYISKNNIINYNTTNGLKDNEILALNLDSDRVYMKSKIKLISPYYVYTSLKDSKNNL